MRYAHSSMSCFLMWLSYWRICIRSHLSTHVNIIKHTYSLKEAYKHTHTDAHLYRIHCCIFVCGLMNVFFVIDMDCIEVTFFLFSDPPTITDSSANVIAAKLGEDITLVCNATGFPAPTIKWYKYALTGSKLGTYRQIWTMMTSVYGYTYCITGHL